MSLNGVLGSAENALIGKDGQKSSQPGEGEVHPLVVGRIHVSIESHHGDLGERNGEIEG